MFLVVSICPDMVGASAVFEKLPEKKEYGGIMEQVSDYLIENDEEALRLEMKTE